MILETKELGFVEIDEADIITFAHEIYGFKGLSQYVLLKDNSKPDNPFMWLQCAESREPCFAVVDPHRFVPDYRPVLSAEDMEALRAEKMEDLRFLALATVPKNVLMTSVNLKCPVVLNILNKTAVQVIMESSGYSMRHYLFEGMRC